MRYEAKKISKLVDELVTYFLHHYNSPAEISIVPESHRYTVKLAFSNVNMSDAEFNALNKRLVVKRQPELEDYYWQLTGEVEDANEMLLVAMMCDSIDLSREGNTIRLTLVREVSGRA